MKIALLGAESTGKSSLAQALSAHYKAQGRRAVAVGEYLREWCAREGRTPRPEEQLPIAQEQERRAAEAAQSHEIVIADTTSVMVAVYSAMLFEDSSFYRFAVESQRGYALTLVTGLDLPWIADGLFRDGPHVREPVDALVRGLLVREGLPFQVVYGQGESRLANAVRAIDSIAARAAPERLSGTFASEKPVFSAFCEDCGDAECEHRLFKGLSLRP